MAVSLLLVGCAQAPVVTSDRPAPQPTPVEATAGREAPPSSGRVMRNADVGFTVELPEDSPLRPARDRGLVASAPDGTRLSVFFEHLAGPATEDGCWARLFERVGAEMPDAPVSATQLRERARAGFARGKLRVYLSIFPRDESCLVLAVDGPRESKVLAQAAPKVLETFHPTAPSSGFAAKLALEAGSQLLDRKEYAAALQRFELALKGEDDGRVRAHFGAGLAAYFLGPDSAAVAADHLSKVVAARADPERTTEDELRQEQYRDALMYLGLAYASLKQFTHATSTLAELVERYPDDAIGRYNFACVLALRGDADSALDELRAALKKDPDLTDHAMKDDDLKSLRDLPAWRALLGEKEPPQPSAAP